MNECSPSDLPQLAEEANLASLCRTCLSSEDVRESLPDTAPPLAQLLRDLAAVAPSAEDGLPTGICGTCLREIASCYRFRRRCQQADAALRRLLTLRQTKRTADAADGETLPVNGVVQSHREKNEESAYKGFDENVSSDGGNDIIQLFGCKYCDFRTELKSEYVMHKKKIHSKVKKIKSGLDASSSKVQYVETFSQSGEKTFKCSVCDYIACAKSSILAHRRTHDAEKPFLCSHCQFRTNFRASLQAHLRIHTGEKPFLCEHCHLRFKQLAHLKQHKLTHSSDRPFSCQLCSYRAKAKRHLDNHQRTHTGDRPFMCDSCSFRCANKVNLMSHKRSHEAAKLFQCQLCSYSSNFKKNLTMHVLKHSGVKAFGCESCDYKGTCAQNLRAHMLSHSKERRFACGQCAYRTKTSSMLKKHFKIHNR